MNIEQVDAHVGKKIRERRTTLGWTQGMLAGKIGVTYQQMHKYERGVNRVSAGRLYAIASELQVDVTYFFEGINDNKAPAFSDSSNRMMLDLARDFASIGDKRAREAISQLCRVLSS